MEDIFLTHLRTLQFWQLRLKGKENDFVYISHNDLSQYNPDLKSMIESKKVDVLEKISSKGYKYKTYKTMIPGGIDLTLIKSKGDELNSTHKRMLYYLMNVSLPNDAPNTVYFDAFLKYKEYEPRLFFTVDKFSKRVHTPITSFKKEYRPNLLLSNEKTASFDVAIMQPLLLGKILNDAIGENDFSSWINKGKDIYVMLQEKANLSTRDEAKKKFFEILFGKPNKQLEALFNASNWINWINEFKNKPFTPNPHTLEKNHSNLAYLLQTTEVNFMTELWVKLIENNIPFVSVHDEVIVQQKNSIETLRLFNSVLENEFSYFKINYDENIVKENTFEPNKLNADEKIISQNIEETKQTTVLQNNIPILWNIDELEAFFKNVPVQQIRLSNIEFITSTDVFVESHVDVIRHNNGKKSFEPYYERLLKLKVIILNNKDREPDG